MSVLFGIRLLTFEQADWDETNRKASAFATLQQNDEEEDEEDDDAMAEDAPPAKAPVAKNVFEMDNEELEAPATNGPTDEPAAAEEADEIT